jgi:hypothetical protein
VWCGTKLNQKKPKVMGGLNGLGMTNGSMIKAKKVPDMIQVLDMPHPQVDLSNGKSGS